MNTESSFFFDSAAGFQAVMENATVGLLVVNQKGVIQYANPFSLILFRYTSKELVGQPIEKLMPESIRESHRLLHVNYFKKPDSRPMGIGMDLYGQKKDGSIFPVEISLSQYTWNGDKMAIAFVNDITIRKEKEETFRNLFENSLSGIYIWDVNTELPIDINEKGLDILGYKKKEDFIDHYNPKIHFVNWADRESMIKFIAERGKVEHLEIELKRVDGKKIWVLLFARLNSAKNILQVVMIDITQRKLTALKYQAIFNNSVAGMYITNLSTLKVTNVNEKGAEMLGYRSKEDFMDHYDPSNHYINPEDQQRNVKMIVEKGNGELFLEQRMKKLDGSPFWARVFIRIDQADNLIHAILLDITESKQTHEELERIVKERTLELTTLLEREKELNDLKSRFVSMASHEFRTPLSTILSSAFLIESCNLQEQEQQRQKHVGRIRSSVKNLTDILNDFLSVDKLEQGKIDVFKKSFDFSEFAQEIVDEVSLIKKSGQQIDFVYEGEKEIVQDKRILRNILLNLFSNAIKYSGENKTIYFYIHVSPERINISLRDEGIGIPEHEQKELFNRFFRASNASTIQGTGLGLNIVKRYLELIGGMIRFESIPEVGSTFIIELARAKQS